VGSVAASGNGSGSKPATAARIYDYFLGGTHNFPADREAAQVMMQMLPNFPATVRANRAFLRRSVRFVADAGVQQFLDIGSGIPTGGNVHEVAQKVAPEARVVYVDIDPVAVSESLDLLEGNDRATAIRGDLRDPQAILRHPQVSRLLDLDQPVGLLLAAVLHFVVDDAVATGVVRQLLAMLPRGSYLMVSHACLDGQDIPAENIRTAQNLYKRQTTTPVRLRSHAQVQEFFAGLDMVEPGLVWLPEWRPEPGDSTEFTDDPSRSVTLAGVGLLP
jgi:hypothetical protein